MSTGYGFADRKKKKQEKEILDKIAPLGNTAPVGGIVREAPEEGNWLTRWWDSTFQGGAFSDGYDAGDITRTYLATSKNVLDNVNEAVLDATENLIDTGAYVAGAVGGAFGADDFQDGVAKFIATDLLKKEVHGKALSDLIYYTTPHGLISTAAGHALGLTDNEKVHENSLLAEGGEQMVQSAAHMVGAMALGGINPALGQAAIGVNAFGSEIEEVYSKYIDPNTGDFKDPENKAHFYAGVNGAVSAAAEIITEKLTGISVGGKAWDTALDFVIQSKVPNKIVKTALKYAKDTLGEGFEEVLSGITTDIAHKFTTDKEKEWGEIFIGEERFQDFMGGALMGGVMGGGQVINSAVKGRDYTSGLTKNEEAVVNKILDQQIAEKQKENGGKKITNSEKMDMYDDIVKQLADGNISIDTIEDVLGEELSPDEYQAYQDALERQTADLQELSDTISDKNELQKATESYLKNSKVGEARRMLGDSIFGKLAGKGDRLAQSYIETAKGSELFQADVSKYDEKQRAIVQKAIDSGILNNRRDTHIMVDTVAKIAADKGADFDFTNNAKLAESKLFSVNPEQINGYYDGQGRIVINISSPKAWQSTVGHEVMHIMESDAELYKSVADAVTEYAKTKGEYDKRFASVRDRYKGVEGYEDSAEQSAKLRKEVVADLVGDYLFEDADFVRNLNATNPKGFKKIWEEIKHLAKLVTAGSKEARQIERVKKTFEEVYRSSKTNVKQAETAQKSTTKDGGVKLSLNIRYSDGSVEVLSDARNLTNEDAVQYLEKAKSGKISGHSYIPVRSNTPQVIIDTMAQIDENIEDNSLVMQARKAQQSMSSKTDTKSKQGNNIRGHGLSPHQIVEIVNNLDNPSMAIYQTNRVNSNGDELPNNVAFFVEYGTDGTDGLAVIEFDSDIDPNAIGTEFGDTRYHTVVTVFKPDTERNGNPFDYAEELLLNPNNIELEIAKGQSARSATQEKLPTLQSKLPSNGSITQNSENSNTQMETSEKVQKFSLSEPVEETKDLLAVHNLSSDKLLKSLKLGGLPMPSVAIARAKDGHTEFGEISLILNKDAIDPKANKDNKVYGRDAWTPTYPTIEYKANDEVVSNIRKKFYELEKKYGRDLADPLYNYAYDAENKIARAQGEQGLLEELKTDDSMMRVFLADTEGKTVPKVNKETVTELGEGTVEQYDYMLNKLGREVFDAFTPKDGASPFTQRRNAWEAHGESIKEAYRQYFAEVHQFSAEDLDTITQNMDMSAWMKEVLGIRKYLANGATTTRTETDIQASKQAVIDAVDSAAYEQWLRNMFGGIEEKSGIRNNRDVYTPSGNRRSWESLHWENTLENVVRVMKEGINGDTLFGGQGIWGVSAKEYNSIDEVKADSGRLTKMSEEEYNAMKDGFTQRLSALSEQIMDKNERNPFTALDTAAENIVDALRNSKKADDVYRYLRKYSKDATPQIAEEVVKLASDIANAPTDYFEAKPRRAVGFDEVAAFVIPRNADVKLKQELLNRGYNIAEYDPDVEGDRQKVVNQFEEYKFSLSDVGTTQKKYGDFATPANRLQYQEIAPVAEDIAPVRADLKNLGLDKTGEMVYNNTRGDDYARTDEFRDLQAEVRSLDETARLQRQLGSGADENLLRRLSGVLQGQLEFWGGGRGIRDGLLTLLDEKTGNQFNLYKQVDGALFHDIFEVTRSYLRNGELVDLHTVETTQDGIGYNDCTNYLSEDGLSGFSITPDGDLISVFNASQKRGFLRAISNVVKENSKTLDCFVSPNQDLREMYQRAFGFKTASVMDYNMEYDHDSIAENHSMPPVAFMVNTESDVETKHFTKDEYEAAVKYRDSFLNQATDNTVASFVPEGSVADDIAPVIEKPAPVAQPRVYEDIAPVKQVQVETEKAKAEVSEDKIAEFLTEEPEAKRKKKGIWSLVKEYVLDNGMVFEKLAKKTNRRELEGRWNSIRYSDSKAQNFIKNGDKVNKSIATLKKEVSDKGLTKQLYEYMYHNLNVDRMSLESRVAPRMAELKGNMDDAQIAELAEERIQVKTDKERANLIRNAKEYVRLSQFKNKPVFGDSVTAEVSKQKVAELEKAHPELKQYAEEIYGNMKSLRQMLVDEGIVSKETAELWDSLYPHYVPIRRAGKDGPAINVPLDTNKTGINAPIKRATGGNSDILPLFDTMGQRAIQTYKAIAKNRFGVELKDALGSIVGETNATIDDAMDGVDNHEALLQKGENGNSPKFTVFEDGKRVTFEISEEMYDAMKPTSDLLSYTNKTLNAIGNFRRGTLTEYNALFLAKNAIKDAQDVLINSQHPARTYAQFPAVIQEMVTKGKWFTEYLENGGEQNTYFDSETNTFKNQGSGVWETVKKFSGLGAVQKANNVIEMMPRLAEYIASRKMGRSIDVSMLDAARVTTNFAAGGKLTKALNRNGFTFLNASVQGAVQQVRNFQEAKQNGLKGALGLAAKFTVAGLPALLLNNLMWDDDEEYEELSDYVKQNYYIVGKFGDGKFVRIPKGRTVAVIQNAFEQMENLVTGDDEVDMKSFLDLMVSNLAPNNPLDNNVLSPIVQVAQNKTWYGEDLVPTRLQNLPAAEQYDETTDELSKWLGEKFNYSPYKINYLLDQYSGFVGDTFLPMMTPESESDAPALLAPAYDAFTTDSVLKNQNVSDFYTKKDELTVNANGRNATDEDILKSKYFNAINAELSELYAMKREIQNDATLSDKEKYEAVREVQQQIVDLARNGLNSYEDVNVTGTYASVGGVQFRYYEPGEDSTAEPGWKKLTDDQIEKQEEVTAGLGISPEEYWSNKEEYDYAFEKPAKYAVAKAVGGYEQFRTYSSELYDIKADKDSEGKSITGSRKEKVLDYINDLDADYGEKIILFKSEYNSDDTYNYEIIDYLNSRDDISYEEMEAILKELGFTVHSDGRVTW